MFGSGQNISRQDAMVMIYNALVYSERVPSGGEAKDFNDKNDIADYAKDSINTLSAAGIISGDDKGNVSPKAQVTRAEAAVMIYNVLMNVNLK